MRTDQRVRTAGAVAFETAAEVWRFGYPGWCCGGILVRRSAAPCDRARVARRRASRRQGVRLVGPPSRPNGGRGRSPWTANISFLIVLRLIMIFLLSSGHACCSGMPPCCAELSKFILLLSRRALQENPASLPRQAPADASNRRLDVFGDEPGPAGLVAGAQPGAVVAVEVLVEQEWSRQCGIGLELLRAAVDGPPAVLVAQEDAGRADRRSPWPPRRGSSSCPTRSGIRP